MIIDSEDFYLIIDYRRLLGISIKALQSNFEFEYINFQTKKYEVKKISEHQKAAFTKLNNADARLFIDRLGGMAGVW